jgi:hypothetical protein
MGTYYVHVGNVGIDGLLKHDLATDLRISIWGRIPIPSFGL